MLANDAQQFSETAMKYGGEEAHKVFTEEGLTELPYDRWVQVRTPAFKAEFGDWETLHQQNRIDAFIDSAIASNDPRETMIFRTVCFDEIKNVKEALGIDITGFFHEFSAHELKHAFNTHKNDSLFEANQRSLTIMDLKRIPVVLDGYDYIRVKPAKQNKTSVIYAKSFGGGRIEYVERLLETSTRKKPRLSTKTVWVKSPTGVESSLPQVYTPERSGLILPFANGRINPVDIAADINIKTGEPTIDFLKSHIPSPLINLSGLGNREAARKLHDMTGGDIAHLPLITASVNAAGKRINIDALKTVQNQHHTIKQETWLKAVSDAPHHTQSRQKDNTR